ncbi:hypothetical protein NBRC116494_07530 [Aurantivibrio plasticivorans]
MSELIAVAAQQVPDWRTLSVAIPGGDAEVLSVTLDTGNGGQPQRRTTVEVDIATGEVSAVKPFSSLSTGRQWRVLLRFLHTGEALGVVGQTIAGLASLASVIMVWTGLALAYRRLLRSLTKRKSKRVAGAS